MTLIDKLTGIVLFVVGILIACVSAFGLFLQISVWFGGNQDVKITQWDKQEVDYFVTFIYVNDKDNKSYLIKKQVQQQSVAELKTKTILPIRYSRSFPSRTEIIGMHEFDYLFNILGMLLMVPFCYRAVQVLRGKFGLRKFIQY